MPYCVVFQLRLRLRDHKMPNKSVAMETKVKPSRPFYSSTEEKDNIYFWVSYHLKFILIFQVDTLLQLLTQSIRTTSDNINHGSAFTFYIL